MKIIQFGIVGGGWRSEFYLRIAQLLPDRFKVCAMVVRNDEKAKSIEARWGVKTYKDVDSMLKATDPEFIVSSVPWQANPHIINEVATCDVPILSETPPAPDVSSMIEMYQKWKHAKIQVAEQYQFQPVHAARIKAVQMGLLGDISQVQLSVAHGYHGISLIRKLLGVGFQDAKISAKRFVSPLVKGPNQKETPTSREITQSNQVVATLEFSNKLGIYDFSDDQYFSWIRKNRILVRGENGEIINKHINYLADFQTPIELEFNRIDKGDDGNLEGYFHKGILVGSDWMYVNPFSPGRLSDDEIAIATCLDKMHQYVVEGTTFYSLADACQDHYLSILINQAHKSEEPIYSVQQNWAE